MTERTFHCVDDLPVLAEMGSIVYPLSINEPGPLTPPYIAIRPTALAGRGIPNAPERPLVRFRTSLQDRPGDFEFKADRFLASARAKALLERFDAAAFDWVECDSAIQLWPVSISVGLLEKDQPPARPGPLYWLCDVIRVLDDVLDEKSSVHSDGSPVSRKSMFEDRKHYSLRGRRALLPHGPHRARGSFLPARAQPARLVLERRSVQRHPRRGVEQPLHKRGMSPDPRQFLRKPGDSHRLSHSRFAP